jgi:GABA permease
MRRYLVVANQTLMSEELRAAVRERLGTPPCRFHVVVPATPPRELLSWTEGAALHIARARLEEALSWMHAEGAISTGSIGDADPVLAAIDALPRDQFDEIVVSTFPPGVSRWIRQDLPHRLARRTELPVCHVVAHVVALEESA